MPLDGVLQNISLTPPHLDKNAVWVHNCNKPNKPEKPGKTGKKPPVAIDPDTGKPINTKGPDLDKLNTEVGVPEPLIGSKKNEPGKTNSKSGNILQIIADILNGI